MRFGSIGPGFLLGLPQGVVTGPDQTEECQ